VERHLDLQEVLQSIPIPKKYHPKTKVVFKDKKEKKKKKASNILCLHSFIVAKYKTKK
jgi:hypothetical protein